MVVALLVVAVMVGAVVVERIMIEALVSSMVMRLTCTWCSSTSGNGSCGGGSGIYWNSSLGSD